MCTWTDKKKRTLNYTIVGRKDLRTTEWRRGGVIVTPHIRGIKFAAALYDSPLGTLFLLSFFQSSPPSPHPLPLLPLSHHPLYLHPLIFFVLTRNCSSSPLLHPLLPSLPSLPPSLPFPTLSLSPPPPFHVPFLSLSLPPPLPLPVIFFLLLLVFLFFLFFFFLLF